MQHPQQQTQQGDDWLVVSANVETKDPSVTDQPTFAAQQQKRKMAAATTGATEDGSSSGSNSAAEQQPAAIALPQPSHVPTRVPDALTDQELDALEQELSYIDAEIEKKKAEKDRAVQLERKIARKLASLRQESLAAAQEAADRAAKAATVDAGMSKDGSCNQQRQPSSNEWEDVAQCQPGAQPAMSPTSAAVGDMAGNTTQLPFTDEEHRLVYQHMILLKHLSQSEMVRLCRLLPEYLSGTSNPSSLVNADRRAAAPAGTTCGGGAMNERDGGSYAFTAVGGRDSLFERACDSPTTPESELHSALRQILAEPIQKLKSQKHSSQAIIPEDDRNVPEFLVCSITYARIKNPVIVNQHIYEKEAIENVIEFAGGKAADPQDPSRQITKADIRTCADVTNIMDEYIKHICETPIEQQITSMLDRAALEVRQFLSALVHKRERLLVEQCASAKEELNKSHSMTKVASQEELDVEEQNRARNRMIIWEEKERDNAADLVSNIEADLYALQEQRDALFHQLLQDTRKTKDVTEKLVVEANKRQQEMYEAAQQHAATVAAEIAEERAAQRKNKKRNADDFSDDDSDQEHTGFSTASRRSRRGCNRRGQQFYQHDSAATSCTRCRTVFTPMNRKHHCRFCGYIYCHLCCNKYVRRRNIPNEDYPVRCCEYCFADQMSQPETDRDIEDQEPTLIEQVRLGAVPTLSIYAEHLAVNVVAPTASFLGAALWEYTNQAACALYESVTSTAPQSSNRLEDAEGSRDGGDTSPPNVQQLIDGYNNTSSSPPPYRPRSGGGGTAAVFQQPQQQQDDIDDCAFDDEY